MRRSLLEAVIARALASGGDYAEVACEDTIRSSIKISGDSVESAFSGRDYGVSVRVFKGGSCAFGYTNDASERCLLRLAARIAGTIGEIGADRPVTLVERLNVNAHAASLLPSSLPTARKTEAMREASAAARGVSAEIRSVTASYWDADQRVLVASSDGAYGSDRRVYSRAHVDCIAGSSVESQSGGSRYYRLAGFESLLEAPPSSLGRRAGEMALTMLHAAPCPGGTMPVVIGNGSGGVFLHEACGHSLEATAVANGNSVYSGKLGQRIASDKVTILDSGLLPNAWGSFNMDDEGIPARSTLLVEKGILKAYMVDRLNGRRIGMAPTGNGRRQSYRYPTTTRMSNTYIEPGEDSEADLFSGVDRGFYARTIGGGTANTETSEFNFNVLEGYMIRHGRIAEPVRGATLVGRACEALLGIDAVGPELRFEGGMCGASSGSLPVGSGIPMVRIGRLVVGGRA